MEQANSNGALGRALYRKAAEGNEACAEFILRRTEVDQDEIDREVVEAHMADMWAAARAIDTGVAWRNLSGSLAVIFTGIVVHDGAADIADDIRALSDLAGQIAIDLIPSTTIRPFFGEEVAA